MSTDNKLLKEGKESLALTLKAVEEAFASGAEGCELTRLMTEGVDRLIIKIWQAVAPQSSQSVDLVAVGGYGRGELAPQSDWDLWFLVPDQASTEIEEDIQRFLYVLWDMNAKVGHAVRTIKETMQHLKEDWNSATAAQEMRLLCGSGEVFQALQKQTDTFFKRKRKKFVAAKLDEHIHRHERTGNSAFMMEPDIKECKGGLRDVQSILWIYKAWFNTKDTDSLVNEGHISPREMKHLLKSQDFLWRCRVGLHLQTKRPGDRLSFEHQAVMADIMGYQSEEHRPAVEMLMKDYFRFAGRIARVSGLLLHDIEEQLNPPIFRRTKKLDDNFTLTGNKVCIANIHVFKQDPLNLLRVFHIAQQDHRRLSSATLRQIREDGHLTDPSQFRDNPEAHRIFLQILRFPRNVAWALKEMNDTGILSLMIPDFRGVVGLGQFNQYHAYTVDEHTIKAVAEARNMLHEDRKARLPLAQELIHRLKRPELLYLALIFHDIAKSMPGDHSKVGEVLARNFCSSIGLNSDDVDLVSWLVRRHLTMAVTSQRFDLSDAEVIQAFAEKVGSLERLNYLLCLTVADISAVGPNVWNDWKGSLLCELYYPTRQMLIDQTINPELIETQKSARIKSTLELAEAPDTVAPVLEKLGVRTIMHFPPHQLLPIASLLYHSGLLEDKSDCAVGHFIDHDRCDTMIMIAANERKGLFAKLTSVIAAGQINVVAAQAYSLGDNKVLDVFYVQDKNQKPLVQKGDIQRLLSKIKSSLTDDTPLQAPVAPKARTNVLMKRVPVRLRTLPLASFKQTAVEVTAADRPGLLAQLAYTIASSGFEIRGAAISSFGERVVDVFFIQHGGKLLNDEQIRELFDKLSEVAKLEETKA